MAKEREDFLNECGHRNSARVKASKELPLAICPACLLERIKELEAENKRYFKDIGCVKSLCDTIDEFGEPMKECKWTNLGERIYEIVVEQIQRIKELERQIKAYESRPVSVQCPKCDTIIKSA